MDFGKVEDVRTRGVILGIPDYLKEPYALRI